MSTSPQTETSAQITLANAVAEYWDDPLGFVLFAYPWGEAGTELEDEEGPDDVQIEFLDSLGREIRGEGICHPGLMFDGSRPVMPVQMSETSGHGTGKSAMGAWIANFIMSTRPFSDGTVTAGTYKQLKSRTWAAIRRWTKLCITSHWFDVQAEGIYHKQHRESWKVEIQSCKEENAQNFAGQHAKRSTSWYLFDEASQVPDGVYTVAYGGLTDGESMFFAWGQPVRNTGEFYEINFGAKKKRWNSRRVDSRKSRLTNKPLIEQWIEDYGLESDFVKVRVLGLPPSASELQYIDKLRVENARQRKPYVLADEPLVAGFDVSGGGRAWNVIRFRRGLDGNCGIPPIRIPGEKDQDRSQRVGICAELLRDTRPDHRLAALFVDAAYGSPIVERLKGLGFKNVFEVNFGGMSPDLHALNMRAYMWMKAKEWLLLGGLPPKDEDLASQLCIPGYHINSSGKLVIESKESITERGEESPDDADAFCLTFAQPVAPPKPKNSAFTSKKRMSAWS